MSILDPTKEQLENSKKAPLVLKIRQTNLMGLSLEQLQAIANIIKNGAGMPMLVAAPKFTDEQIEQVKKELSQHKDTIIVAPPDPEPIYLVPTSEDLEEEDEGCPKDDPGCLSRADECHETCERPASVAIECPVVSELEDVKPKRKRAIASKKAPTKKPSTKKSKDLPKAKGAKKK